MRSLSLVFYGLLALLGSTGAVATEADAAQQHRDADAVCTKCHDENDAKPLYAIYQTKHGVLGDARTPSCTACHGDSKKHLAGAGEGGGKRPPPDFVLGTTHTSSGYAPNPASEQSGRCLTCHKSGMRTHWSGSVHDTNDVSCTSCHKVHVAQDAVMNKVEEQTVCFECHKEQRAQVKQFSTHPLDAGKMSCSSCHNPHGSVAPKLLTMNTVNDTCFQCHADKRGPFLWEHQPVTEDCGNCHTPHGSNITPLLKSRAPFLCDECHSGPHTSSSSYGTAVTGIQGGGVAPGGNPSTSAAGRACMNCHSMVHGSNSPAGALLHR